MHMLHMYDAYIDDANRDANRDANIVKLNLICVHTKMCMQKKESKVWA